MFYSLWPRDYKKYSANKAKNLRINMFICVCGEPADVVRQTIEGAKSAVDHYMKVVKPKYKPQIIVLNDGRAAKRANWKEIVALAKSMGVRHITRTIPGGFKAGNINNALKLTPTPDAFNTLDVVFDSDFAAKKYFLTEMTKPFADQTVDFAQSPQRYKNEQSWVAKSSAAHQIFFFDHICASKGHDNALFLCGTNFAIRRSALDAIGGMDTRYITEDYATSLELHLRGMKGVFVPKVLAVGMAPTSLKQYFSQQQRWAKGSFDVSRDYFKRIVFGPMSLRQKFHYLLSASYYLIGIRDLILMLAPLPYLFWGVSLIKPNTAHYLAFIYAPLLAYNFILYTRLFRAPLKSIVLDVASFPVFTAAFLSSAFKKDLSFIVTIKKYERENPFAVYKLQLAVAALLAFGLFIGFQHSVNSAGAYLNYFWAAFDVSILSLGFYLIIRENYNTSFIEKPFIRVGSVAKTVLTLPARVPRVISIPLGTIIAVIAGYALITAISESNASLTSTAASPAPFVSTVYAPGPIKDLLVPDYGTYYGYYRSNLDTHPIEPVTETVVGEKTSLVMFYQDWSDKKFDAAFLTRLADGGRIPVITWEPWNSSKNDPDGVWQKDYSVESIINGDHDEFIREWARGAKEYRQPLFLRFAHEMNGNWYPWSSRYNLPDGYIAMWKHVHNIFTEEGANNVMWVWAPNNTAANGTTDNMLSFYPGDEFVDWVGFSGFNWGTTSEKTRWTSFSELAEKAYGKLETIDKPIMVTETSTVSTGGNKQLWFKNLLKVLPQFPRIKAIVLFDKDINGADFSLNSGADFNGFASKEIINNKYLLQFPVLKDQE